MSSGGTMTPSDTFLSSRRITETTYSDRINDPRMNLKDLLKLGDRPGYSVRDTFGWDHCIPPFFASSSDDQGADRPEPGGRECSLCHAQKLSFQRHPVKRNQGCFFGELRAIKHLRSLRDLGVLRVHNILPSVLRSLALFCGQPLSLPSPFSGGQSRRHGRPTIQLSPACRPLRFRPGPERSQDWLRGLSREALRIPPARRAALRRAARPPTERPAPAHAA